MIVKPAGATAIHGDRSEFIYFQLPEMCEQKFDILGTAITKSNVNNSGDYYVRVSDLLFKPGIDTIIASGPPWRQDQGAMFDGAVEVTKPYLLEVVKVGLDVAGSVDGAVD